MYRTLIVWPDGQVTDAMTLSFVPSKGEVLFDGYYCEWCVEDGDSLLMRVSRRTDTETK